MTFKTVVFASFAFHQSISFGAEPLFTYATPKDVGPHLAGIHVVSPPREKFFAKETNFEGILISSSAVVDDRALAEARSRLEMMFHGFGSYRAFILSHLVAQGVELHVIGRAEQVSDLPENASRRGKAELEYGGHDIDERTRGTGGRLSSCGEENLLRLTGDRYRGRDICVHEFAHCFRNFGLPKKVADRFDRQYDQCIRKGRWLGSYAGSNEQEFFAELSAMYFRKPAGLKAYDPESYALFDALYTGRWDVHDFADGAWPNQSLEPMARSVTSSAGAEGAPAPAMAHH